MCARQSLRQGLPLFLRICFAHCRPNHEEIHEPVAVFLAFLGREQLVAVGVFKAKIDNAD